ncbi:MAG: hypothetical protein ABIR50_10885 [Ginsengibacter sp.]
MKRKNGDNSFTIPNHGYGVWQIFLIKNIPCINLAGKINWQLFDDAFKKHYSQKMGAHCWRKRPLVPL